MSGAFAPIIISVVGRGLTQRREPALSEEKRAQTITNIMRFGYQYILDRRYTPAGVSSVEMKARSTGRSDLVLFSMWGAGRGHHQK